MTSAGTYRDEDVDVILGDEPLFAPRSYVPSTSAELSGLMNSLYRSELKRADMRTESSGDDVVSEFMFTREGVSPRVRCRVCTGSEDGVWVMSYAGAEGPELVLGIDTALIAAAEKMFARLSLQQ